MSGMKISLDAAMRARDVSQPREADEAAAQVAEDSRPGSRPAIATGSRAQPDESPLVHARQPRGAGVQATGPSSTRPSSTGLPGARLPGTRLPGTGLPSTGLPSTGSSSTAPSSTRPSSTGHPGTGLPDPGLAGTGRDGTGRDGTGRDGTGRDGTGSANQPGTRTRRRTPGRPRGRKRTRLAGSQGSTGSTPDSS